MQEDIKIKQEDAQTVKEDTQFILPVPKDFSDRVPRDVPTVGGDIKISHDFVASGVVYATAADVTVDASTGGTTETNLATYTFPKNCFHVGSIIRMTAGGHFSSNITPQFTLRVGRGNAPTTAFNDMPSWVEQSVNMPWELRWIGMVTSIGSSGKIATQLRSTQSTHVIDDYSPGLSNFNTTTSFTLALTCQWSSNQVDTRLTLRQLIIEVLN